MLVNYQSIVTLSLHFAYSVKISSGTKTQTERRNYSLMHRYYYLFIIVMHNNIHIYTYFIEIIKALQFYI